MAEDEDRDGKLKYIGGIPYLSSKHIHIEERAAPARWFERLTMYVFTGWMGNLVLGILLFTAVLGAAVILDLLIVAVGRH